MKEDKSFIKLNMRTLNVPEYIFDGLPCVLVKVHFLSHAVTQAGELVLRWCRMLCGQPSAPETPLTHRGCCVLGLSALRKFLVVEAKVLQKVSSYFYSSDPQSSPLEISF